MEIWIIWWNLISLFRGQFNRQRTFLWFATCVAAFCVRGDKAGVTSFVRAFGLKKSCYDCLRNFFHCSGVNLNAIARKWMEIVVNHFPGVAKVNGRICLIGDGLKYPKSGRKMPAVKRLHQQSESNTKPEFIMGHSFQVIGLLCMINRYALCVPLVARIHEGLLFSAKAKTTLLDKMLKLLQELLVDNYGAYFIVDAYYCSSKIVKGLIDKNHHLITRARSNAVAYESPPKSPQRKRGRPRKYGKKLKLKNRFRKDKMTGIDSPVYGEKNVRIAYRCLDLMWRPTASLVRFVLVEHPLRGRIILMSTDLTLEPAKIIELYAYRFKIEVSFKQAIYTLGTYQYHFWMKAMKPIKRNQGDQKLHNKSDSYQQQVLRKMKAYHSYVQCAVIAQGTLQYLAAMHNELIWKHFGSWLKTIRPGVLPSENVCSIAMNNTIPDFLTGSLQNDKLQKFIRSRIDLNRAEGSRLVA